MQAGGWTPFETKITTEEQKVFKTATENLLGVDYQPLAVATQVVAGTNYSYFCNATLVTPERTTYTAMVNIYQQPDGDVQLREIRQVRD